MSKLFEVTISQTLSRSVNVDTDDYDTMPDPDDGGVIYITDDTDWKAAYEENYYTIPELLEILKKDAKHRLLNTENPKKRRYYQRIIDSCKGWCVDDYEVI